MDEVLKEDRTGRRSFSHETAADLNGEGVASCGFYIVKTITRKVYTSGILLDTLLTSDINPTV